MRARPLRRVSSARNPALALVRALESKKTRRERRLVVLEGEDLVDAGLAAGLRPVALIVDEERVPADDPRLAATADVDERYAVPGELLKKVSALGFAPRMIGVFPQPGPHDFRGVPMPPSLALWLAGVGDPGNVGTLIRTAAALGCEWVGLGPGSADGYSPKAVRAAMGATFRVPLLEGVSADDLATREGIRIVAAVVHGGRPPWAVDLAAPAVIALGAERAGLDASLGPFDADQLVRVTIPQEPGAESLNVAAAGAILLAEARRQRVIGAPRVDESD
jgi:TrmH family RNA methyltransferase